MNVRHNIADLNRLLPLYQQLSRKSSREVLEKLGTKLAKEVYFQLRDIRPPKGNIRATLLERLKSGRGIKIRPSVQESVAAKWTSKFQSRQAREEDKFWGESPGRINWKFKLRQKMVQTEIGLRESGRGVLAISSRYNHYLTGGEKAISRGGQLLSQFGISMVETAGVAQLLWPGLSKQSQSVVGGLQRQRGAGAIKNAVANVRDDTLVYVQRKQREIAERAAKAMVRA